MVPAGPRQNNGRPRAKNDAFGTRDLDGPPQGHREQRSRVAPRLWPAVPAFEHATEPSAPPAAAERAASVWGEAEAERAAIVENDSMIPRDWAEGFARLDPDRSPRDVPLRRWQQFVDDVGQFLDSPFCAIAAALGDDARRSLRGRLRGRRRAVPAGSARSLSPADRA